MLLSSLSADALESLLPAKLERATPHSIVEKDALVAELKQVRRLGYANNLSESDQSVHAVAVPVRDGHDQYIAALSVAAPTTRLPAWRASRVVPMLNQASEKITADYTGGTPSLR